MGTETLVLAIDQGTTSTRAILFDAAGQPRQSAQIALTQLHARPGWVEHDPEEIWRSVLLTCRQAIAGADGPIAAVGITNQRETTVLWERATGRPVNNAIVWQDRRTTALCERWRSAGLTEIVGLRTGLVIDPYFSASKIRWLLDNVPGLGRRARAGEIAFGTIDSFLLWRLSGGRRHATDVTNAARTMLFDIGRLTWDVELLDAFGIPRALLPEVLDTGADYGATAPDVLGPAIPIAGMAGDQQAAAIGQACFRPGMIKTTYGTGAFALLNIGGEPAASRHKLLTTVAYRLRGETAYALEGSIFVAGGAVEWLRDRLGAIAEAAEVTILAARADPQERLYLVPGFAGLGAPYWSPHARGGLLGLTTACGLPEIARAVLEAVGYQTRDLIEAMMADAGITVGAVRVDGGMAANDWTMQFLADILPARVERPASVETTAPGVLPMWRV
jgi:glycerol kinase